MSPKPKTNSQKVEIFLPPDTVKELKKEAELKGTSVSGLIRMLILERYTKVKE